jgi:hypothetical protein
MSNDLRIAARTIVSTKTVPGAPDLGSQSTLVNLATFFVNNTVDDPDSPADLDWLESRGWIIVKRSSVDTPGALFRLPPIGPFSRRINIDEAGCSITSVASVDAERFLAKGITVSDLPKATELSLPVCVGWPSRKLVLALEQLAKHL